jgi:hypothetical protein
MSGNDMGDFPQELVKIMRDFICDILNTFPEYHEKFTENELEFLQDTPNKEKIYQVFEYCKKIYPPLFFDLLYEKEELFVHAEKNTHFFEKIDFKMIWKENISDNTKKIIWKYLQLVLFSLSNTIDGAETFGDTAKLFEAIDEGELKTKLEEVVGSMNDIFDSSKNAVPDFKNMMEKMSENMDLSGAFGEEFANMMEQMDMSGGFTGDFNDIMKNMTENMDISGTFNDDFLNMMKNMSEQMDMSGNGEDMSGNFFNGKDIPDPENIHEHLNSLMGGKIGKLAKEIADETANELDMDGENMNSVTDVFSKLFKNPGKLMGMIKKVSSKLDEKLKSGEIKESELMKEASDLVNKMKNTPGMKDMEKMISKMGLGGKGMGGKGMGGKKGKVNMNLFQSMMKNNIQRSSQRERMLQKLEKRKQEKALQAAIEAKINKKPIENELIQKTFNVGDKKMEKSKIKHKKKKKRKKNKNKK